MFIEIKRHIFARLGVAAHAVFRPVKRHELHVRVRAKQFNDAVELRIHAGRIGDQADVFAADQIKMLREQDFNAEFDGRVRGWILWLA